MKGMWVGLAAKRVCIAVLVSVCVGCPSGPKDVRAIALLTADGSSAKAFVLGAAQAQGVAVESIDMLSVVISGIFMDYAGTRQPVAGQEPAETIEVFSGELEVNLKDLIGVSQALSSLNIPAGWYTEIRLTMENPRLTLKDNPDTVITDIELPGNGQVTFSEMFELAAGKALVSMDLGGIDLTTAGNGEYVFSPQLLAEFDASSAAIIATGPLGIVGNDSMSLNLSEGALNVQFRGASIFMPQDTTQATGTAANLLQGSTVSAIGTVNLDGTVAADEIHVSGPPAV
jgi:hypothetical protein